MRERANKQQQNVLVMDKHDIVVRRRYRNPNRTWSAWKVLLRRRNHFNFRKNCNNDTNTNTNNNACNETQQWTYQFENNGGILRVHLNILSKSMKNNITNEIINNSNYFRQYRVQTVPEPRVHYLLHEDATDDFTR